jgi:hypothetical protein
MSVYQFRHLTVISGGQGVEPCACTCTALTKPLLDLQIRCMLHFHLISIVATIAVIRTRLELITLAKRESYCHATAAQPNRLLPLFIV